MDIPVASNTRFRTCARCGKQIDTHHTSYFTAYDVGVVLCHFHTTCGEALRESEWYADWSVHPGTITLRGAVLCKVCTQMVRSPYQINMVGNRMVVFCSHVCVDDHHNARRRYAVAGLRFA